MDEFKVVILAAGEGTRMKSSLPKVLHKAAGKSLLGWVAEVAKAVSQKPVVVYGSGAETIPDTFGNAFTYARQEKRLGTGHAVMMAKEEIKDSVYTVVLAGDMPLIREETVRALCETIKTAGPGCGCALLTASPAVTPAFGRVVRDGAGKVCGIVEDKDAAPEEKEIKELNLSIYCFKTSALLEAIQTLRPENAQHEYYLTDCVKILYERGYTVESLSLPDMQEAIGVNTRAQLAQAEAALRRRINEALLLSGVSMIDPAATYIDAGVTVGPDTLLYPGVILQGDTKIGSGCTLYQGSRLVDTCIADGTTVENSVLIGAVVGRQTKIGPYTYLRPETVIGDRCRVGDFVEMKNAKIGNDTKVSHLTYVGDAVLGSEVNLGCGVVFANFDGQEKYISTVGDKAFIGCNTNLISPVRVGKGAYIAAGTTITKDIPPDALVIGRVKEVVKPGWAKGRYRANK